MNWFGNQKGEGAEFFLLAIGMCVSLMVSGPDALSVDAVLSSTKTIQRKRVSARNPVFAHPATA
ncbi:MAG TPA: hypothetical protein VM871_00395 [Flavisolibacter sp.]|nr:hypothetical protein [Flavisolibacter sp.]